MIMFMPGILTHRGWDKFTAILQTAFTNSFFLNENVRISSKIWLKFVPKMRINNIPALIQIMAWRRPGDKSLSEPMMIILLTHICVIWPQWVNTSHQVNEPCGSHHWIKIFPWIATHRCLKTIMGERLTINSLWDYQLHNIESHQKSFCLTQHCILLFTTCSRT